MDRIIVVTELVSELNNFSHYGELNVQEVVIFNLIHQNSCFKVLLSFFSVGESKDIKTCRFIRDEYLIKSSSRRCSNRKKTDDPVCLSSFKRQLLNNS